MEDKRFVISVDVLVLSLLMMAHLWFNPVSTAFIIVLLAAYVVVDRFFPLTDGATLEPAGAIRYLYSTRLVIVFFMVMVAVLLPTGLNIMRRHSEGRATNVNDGLLQTEIATQFLLDGKNPYTENYLNTPLSDWKGGEPPWTPTLGPLYHNAYLPFLFLESIPFYLLSNAVLGWYDERFLYVLLFFATLLIALELVSRQRDKLVLTSALGLNFLSVYMLADGRNDVVILFDLVAATFLVARHRVWASSVIVGLALATKHQAWFFLPFFLFYLSSNQPVGQAIRDILKKTWPLFATVSIILFPFLIWDASAFLDDTVLYLFGATDYSYPIRGWGLSAILRGVNVIPTADSAFPFGLLELIFGLPTLFLLLRWQSQQNTLQTVWVSFAVLSFVVEFSSRFFNDNYFIFIFQALLIGAFIAPYSWNRHVSAEGEPIRRGADVIAA